jgi:EthD domain
VPKMTTLIVRHPSLTKEAFEQHHREIHAPLFAANPAAQKHVKRYVLSYPTRLQPPGLARTPCDAIVEFWFDGVAGMMATFTHPHYLSPRCAPMSRFMDMERSSFIVTRETVVIQHDPDLPVSDAHDTDRRLTAGQHRHDIGLEHGPPVSQFAIDDGAWMMDSRCVDDNIEPSSLLGRLCDEGLQLVVVVQIECPDACVAAPVGNQTRTYR